MQLFFPLAKRLLLERFLSYFAPCSNNLFLPFISVVGRRRSDSKLSYILKAIRHLPASETEQELQDAKGLLQSIADHRLSENGPFESRTRCLLLAICAPDLFQRNQAGPVLQRSTPTTRKSTPPKMSRAECKKKEVQLSPRFSFLLASLLSTLHQARPCALRNRKKSKPRRFSSQKKKISKKCPKWCLVQINLKVRKCMSFAKKTKHFFFRKNRFVT